MEAFYIVLSLVLGAASGFLAACVWLVPSVKTARMQAQQAQRLQQEVKEQQDRLLRLDVDNARLREQAASLEKQRVLVEKNFSELSATYRAQFADLAAKILEEKSKGLESKTTETLRPLALQLETFFKKVTDMERLTSEKQSLLEKGLADVIKSTEKIDQSALDLTAAIKGRPEVRGSWGEEALRRILEISGLKRGVDYFEQVSDGGKRLDVQIALPAGRWIVVDSKTIFNHYAQYYQEENPQKKEAFLAEHVKDIKATIKDLSSKKYYLPFQKTGEKMQPDYTLMFVSPESALFAALSKDPDIVNEAWKNDVALVSSSSLINTLKMVARLWNIERQNEYMDELKEDVVKLMERFNEFLVSFAKTESAVANAYGAIKTARTHIDGNNGALLPTAQRIIDVYEAPITKDNARLLKRMGYDYNGSKRRGKVAVLPEGAAAGRQEALSDSSEAADSLGR